MNKPPKYEILAFIKQEKSFFTNTSLGYKILSYLEELINKQKRGKNNGRSKKDKA